MSRCNIQIDAFSRLIDFWWLWPVRTEFVHPLLAAFRKEVEETLPRGTTAD